MINERAKEIEAIEDRRRKATAEAAEKENEAKQHEAHQAATEDDDEVEEISVQIDNDDNIGDSDGEGITNASMLETTATMTSLALEDLPDY